MEKNCQVKSLHQEGCRDAGGLKRNRMGKAYLKNERTELGNMLCIIQCWCRQNSFVGNSMVQTILKALYPPTHTHTKCYLIPLERHFLNSFFSNNSKHYPTTLIVTPSTEAKEQKCRHPATYICFVEDRGTQNELSNMETQHTDKGAERDKETPGETTAIREHKTNRGPRKHSSAPASPIASLSMSCLT